MSEPDSETPSCDTQGAVLRAAREIELRPFLRESLQGAISVSGASQGAVVLTVSGEEHGRRDAGDEEILTFVRPGEAGRPRWFLPRDLRRIDARADRTIERLPWGILGLTGDGHAATAPAEAILIPLCSSDRHLGSILLVPRSEGGAFTEVEFQRTAEFSRLLAPFLANVLRVRDLEDTVVRDDMAECYNRRYLDEFLSQETARARRFRKPLSLIFLDMDDLKSVNSEHGHGAGSRVLQEVARRIGTATRRIDKLFRFGGDEFCLILPETDLNGARRVAERVRGAISSGEMLASDIPGGVNLTASLGIASFPVHSATGEGMLAAADASMRAIKLKGKNAVGIAEPSFPWEQPNGADDH